MKRLFLTAMLLGLLTGICVAQRGRTAPMPMNRGMTQMGHWGQTESMGPTARTGQPSIVRPNAVPMAPVASRPVTSTMPPTAGVSQPNVGGTLPNAGPGASSVGNTGRSVAPPDAAVGPNVSHRTLQK